MAPVRVQRKRVRGWRMPPNTVYVGRPTKWGNPWSVKGVREWLRSIGHDDTFSDNERHNNCIYNYRLWMENGLPANDEKRRRYLLGSLEELRGKNLACWCRLDQRCHADVLLRLANVPPNEPR